MDSRKLTHEEEEEEEERRRQRRKEWIIQRQLEKKHEERKRMMIEKFERQRAERKLDIENKSRRSKSASPHRSTDCKRSEEFKVSSTLKDFEHTKIDTKELHRIKVKIQRISATNVSKTESEPNINNSLDVVIPRRKDEGSRPIFDSLVISEKQSSRSKDDDETSRGDSNCYNYTYTYNYNYNSTTADNITSTNKHFSGTKIQDSNLRASTRTRIGGDRTRIGGDRIGDRTRIGDRIGDRTHISDHTRISDRTHVDHGSRLDHVNVKHRDDKRSKYDRYERDRSRSPSASNHSKRRTDDRTDRYERDYLERSHRSHNPSVSNYPAPRLPMNCPPQPYIHNYINYMMPFPGALPMMRPPLAIMPHNAAPLNMLPYPRFLPRAPNMNAWRPPYNPRNQDAN